MIPAEIIVREIIVTRYATAVNVNVRNVVKYSGYYSNLVEEYNESVIRYLRLMLQEGGY